MGLGFRVQGLRGGRGGRGRRGRVEGLPEGSNVGLLGGLVIRRFSCTTLNGTTRGKASLLDVCHTALGVLALSAGSPEASRTIFGECSRRVCCL